MGALLGAAFYAAHGLTLLSSQRGFSLSPAMLFELPLWLALMALTVLPVAFVSGGAVRIALHLYSWPPLLTACLLVPVFAAGSYFAFAAYMSEVAPAVNWTRGWWLPAGASAAAIVIEAMMTPGRPSLKRP